MGLHRLSEMTWTEVQDLELDRTVAILPIGAVEAHGPHLPISTDRIIARAMAEDGGRRLCEHGFTALLLPPIDYTSASFAAGFSGTVSIRPETVTALLADVAIGLAQTGVRCLAWANAHLDPTHLQSLYDALGRIRSEGGPPVAFPDVTRKPWALRLTEEFKSGACHAGQYEGSVVLARRAELVRDDVRLGLQANPESLARAIWKGLSSFEEAGGPQAYFGDPAAATAEEGIETIAVLGQILEESVLQLLAG